MKLHQDYEFAAALPNAIIVLDFQKKILWWNDAATKFFALDENSKRSLITKVIQDENFWENLENSANHKYEMPAPCKPDSRLAVSLIPYYDEGYLLIADDMTHVYQLEHVRQDFVANVSHELRTPLTVVKGYLEILLEQSQQNANQFQNMFLQMHQQVLRIENLVKDLLLLARLEADTLEITQLNPIDVSILLKSICEEAKVLSGTQAHQIKNELDENLKIYGNEDELRSAFSNLIFNAVRYTPAKGKIIIKWFKDAAGAHMQVIDTGIGIEVKYIPRLTERFYRVDKARSRDAGGTGLGLAIVKHVLIRHNAELKITSEIGKGSVFQCDFPEKMCC